MSYQLLKTPQGECVSLRELATENLRDIVVIESAAHSHPCSEGILAGLLTRATTQILGLFVDNDNVSGAERLAAFSIVSKVVDESELINIAVHPDFQGRGFGRLLLEQAIAALPTQVQGMFLEVRESNQSAIALYDSMGFIETGIRKNYYPAGSGSEREDAVLMVLDLSFAEGS